MSNMATNEEDIELQDATEKTPAMESIKKDKSETDSKKEKTETYFATGILNVFNVCVVFNVILISSVLIVTIAWLMFVNNQIVDFDAAPNLYCTDCNNVDQSLDRAKYFFSIDGNSCCADKNEKYLEYIMNKVRPLHGNFYFHMLG